MSPTNTLDLIAARGALDAVGGRELGSLQLISASALAAQYYPQLDPAQPLLVLGPADGATLARLSAVLLQAYPPEQRVSVLGDTTDETTVGDLPASGALGADEYLLVQSLAKAGSYEAVQEIAAHLRAPEGCPWDRELTWARLRAHLLEETHELLAALDANDARKVSEELGDLLLQVAMQTQIAAEEGLFRFPDVAEHIVNKLIRRHPHVFGDAVVSGTDEVLANWEAIKRAERAQNNERKSPLSGIPTGLPALAQADAYLDRVSRVEAVEAPDAPWSALADLPADAPVTSDQVGEALFGLVAWARKRGIDAESALREANARYARRVEQEEG
jgi:tetrapyrrole methylase family protein/MazG family protein